MLTFSVIIGARPGGGVAVPTITLTMETLHALGVSLADLLPSVLQRETATLLEPLLASRGFDLTRDVRIVVLATGEGVVLTQ